MAFESTHTQRQVTKRSSNRNTASSGVIQMSIRDEKFGYYKDKIRRTVNFAFDEIVMEKLNLFEKSIEFLIDRESNLGMIKLNKCGNKISTPKKNGVPTTKKGYIKMGLPEYFEPFDNHSLVSLDVVEYLDDAVIFNIPKLKVKLDHKLKELQDKFYEKDGLAKLIKDECNELEVTLLDTYEFKVINKIAKDIHGDGDIYKRFSYDDLSKFIHGWTECMNWVVKE